MSCSLPFALRFDRVDSAYLDCLDDNLAVLLDLLGTADIRSPFAWQWFFDFDPLDPSLAPSLRSVPILEVLSEHCGVLFDALPFEPASFPALCRAFLAQRRPPLLFGDAFFMPWLPYFEHEHLEHSFLVAGISDDGLSLQIADAYANRTEWGQATPTCTSLPSHALERIVRALETPRASTVLLARRERSVSPPDPAALLRLNAAHMQAQLGLHDRLRCFSRTFASRLDDLAALKQFVLACWLVVRARALHQLFLADLAQARPELLEASFAEQFAQQVVAPWQRVSEFAYILLRRVRLGRAAPTVCFELLEQSLHPAELALAERLEQRLSERAQG